MAYFEQYTTKKGEKLWRFKTYLGVDPTTGKEVRTTRSKFKTRKAAVLAEKQLALEFSEKGTLTKAPKDTFKDVYQLWYETYRQTVREVTSMKTERYMLTHILPAFGDCKIDKITPKMAQEAINKWADQLQIYKILHQYCIRVMDYAITLGMIEKNPFEKLIRPKVKKTHPEKEVKFYTTEQIQYVMNYLEEKIQHVPEHNLLYRYFAEWDLAMYRTLAFVGLRGGEALALTFKDIDFTNKTITIDKTLTLSRKGFVVGPPKTKSSNRTIPVDDKTIRILKKWQLRQKEMHFQNGVRNNDIVFSDMHGNYSNRQALYARSKRLAEATGLPNIGTHGWRHSNVSMLYEAGVDMKETQLRLGHATMAITNEIYLHLSDKQNVAAVEKLAKFANF